jgi:hypothetical protein
MAREARSNLARCRLRDRPTFCMGPKKGAQYRRARRLNQPCFLGLSGALTLAGRYSIGSTPVFAMLIGTITVFDALMATPMEGSCVAEMRAPSAIAVP